MKMNANSHNRWRCGMTASMKIITLSIFTIIIIFSMVNCSPSVSSEDYDSMKSELETVENQLIALQEKLAEAALIETQYQSLNNSFEELQKQYDARNAEIQKLKTDYDDLNTKYEQLKEPDDVPDMVFNEEEIEQAIFTLINQERINNGIDALLWGKNLHGWARGNSYEMADTLRTKYSEWASWQEIFWAAGYDTTEAMSQAAILIWRTNPYRYDQNIVNTGAKYGAVGVYHSGDIYYITYMASTTR